MTVNAHPIPVDASAAPDRRHIYVARGRWEGHLLPMPQIGWSNDDLLTFARILAGHPGSDAEKWLADLHERHPYVHGADYPDDEDGIMFMPLPWHPRIERDGHPEYYPDPERIEAACARGYDAIVDVEMPEPE